MRLKIQVAKWIFRWKWAASSLTRRASRQVVRALGFGTKIRWLIVAILTAAIGSYAAPIAVERYQRSVALRDESARLCDQLIRTRAELQSSVDAYRDAQQAFWERRFDLQLTRARFRAARSARDSELYAATAAAESDAIQQAMLDVREARRTFESQYAAFYVWRIEGAIRCENLYPDRQRETRSALTSTARALQLIRRRFNDREIGFRVMQVFRDHALSKMTDDLSSGAISRTEFDVKLLEGSVVFDDDPILENDFLALTALARRLAREEPSQAASLLRAMPDR
jgi:hypothetical protein